MSKSNRTQNYHAAAYRTVIAVFLVLALGGLFIGLLQPLLADVHEMFTTNFFSLAAAGEVPEALNGSIFGYIWNFFTTAFNEPDFTTLSNCFAFGRVFFLLGSVLAAIICLIVACVSKKSARRCALATGVLVTLAYSWLFVGFALSQGGETFASYDAIHLFFTAILVVVLAVVAMCANKGTGALSCFGLILTFAAVVGCIYPGSVFRTSFAEFLATPIDEYFAAIDFGAAAEAFLAVMPVVLLALIAFNFVASFIRVGTKRGYAFDAVRYTLLFLGAVLFMVAHIVNGTGFVDFFLEGEAIAIAPILLLGASLLLCVLYIIAAVVARGQSRRVFLRALDEDDDDDEDEDEDESDSGRSTTRNHIAPVYINNVTTPAAAPARAAAPAPAPAPAPMYQPVYQRPYVQPYVQTYMQPYVQPVYYPVAPATPANAPANGPAPASAPAEETMSDFEKSMLALADGTDKSAAPAPAPAPAETSAPASAPAPAPAAAPVPETYGTYVYDTFFSSLPAQEKNEFGDLFIGKKSGDFGLPTYAIGEDNSEFFGKFFVRLAKIRPHISASLLDKIYNYITKK